jgi:hypothetical protein
MARFPKVIEKRFDQVLRGRSPTEIHVVGGKLRQGLRDEPLHQLGTPYVVDVGITRTTGAREDFKGLIDGIDHGCAHLRSGTRGQGLEPLAKLFPATAPRVPAQAKSRSDEAAVYGYALFIHM